jgi:DNA processing protein
MELGGFRNADDVERDAWVVLNGVTGVGPVSFGRLVAFYGSAAAVLGAARRTGAVAGLVAATGSQDGGGPTLAPSAGAAIVAAALDPGRLLVPVRRSGLQVLTLADEAYPSRLRRVDLPPPVLFLHGDPAALDRARAVAIVGTRRPTGVGRATAGRIAEAVSGLGVTIVSGLALGIDAAAHAAAVRLGTPTIAVIGGGHDRLYPAGHRGLARAIAAGGGAVVSEFAPDTVPTRGTFPRRNRIISGLADATVVVEAGARSGALTTAAWALEQGRGLHLVPGRLDDPAVAGCLAFLREAGPEARIVAGIPELLEDLGLLGDRMAWASNVAASDPVAAASDPVAAASDPVAAASEVAHAPGGAGATPVTRPAQTSLRAVLSCLGSLERAVALEVVAGRGTVDELVFATGATGAAVLGVLTVLEVRGLVLEAYGRYRAAGPLASAADTRRPRPARVRAA